MLMQFKFNKATFLLFLKSFTLFDPKWQLFSVFVPRSFVYDIYGKTRILFIVKLQNQLVFIFW